jgi:ferritin-like metal-binding protein YciE
MQDLATMGQEPKGAKCPAIDGLISEANDVAGEVADKNVLDAAVVGAAQAVEHYEIARYGTLIAWADELGREDVIRLLTTNLNEEKAADKKLSTVALRKGVNPRRRVERWHESRQLGSKMPYKILSDGPGS